MADTMTTRPIIDPSRIPESAADGWAAWVLSNVREFFADPEHEAEYQRLQKERNAATARRE